jgi:hypothetical protein
MEEMKFVENPTVNAMVSEIIEALKEEIVSNLHPKSIILIGSFGKGEVTVIEDGGNLKFLSDCEVIIIPNKYVFNRDKIEKISDNFYEKTNLKVDISGVILSVYLLFPFLSRKLRPTMAIYDLKYGSKVIYGKDYLERIPNFKPGDIPLWEGIRLLFNRMAEALEHFSLKNPSEEMVYWTDKIVLACQDALLLSLGEYHFSYRKRNEMFQSLFPECFGGLEDELPNFLGFTIEATERKLNGTMNVNDPVEYWFDAAKMCDKVFRYVIKKDMGIEFNDYLEFQEKYLRNIKIRTDSCGFFTHPMYQNLRSVMKMLVLGHRFPTIKQIWKVSIPWTHAVYSMIPIFYFDVSKDGKVDELSLTKTRESLPLLRKLSYSNSKPSQVWEYTMKQALDLWRTVCY